MSIDLARGLGIWTEPSYSGWGRSWDLRQTVEKFRGRGSMIEKNAFVGEVVVASALTPISEPWLGH